MFRFHARRTWVAFLVLLLGLGISMTAWWAEARYTPEALLAGDAMISLLLAGIVYVQIRARELAERTEAANHAKDQFLAVLSHELRNPLSPVLTKVNMLQQQARRRMTLTREELAEALDVIQRNVQLEARLIDDLLDMTRITRGKLHLDMEPTNVHVVLHHALEICEADLRNKRLRLEQHMDATAHYAQADPARLQQILWNLLKNAIKFTPEDGTISVRTRDGEKGSIVISVTDTGIGIDPPALTRIFDAFEQADRSIAQRFGGLGLGLAISRALTDAHHGHLAASSDGKGRGATFTLELPTIPTPAALPTQPPAAVDSHVKVLLVEDQDDARRGMRLILERSGYEVRTAASVAEAKHTAEEYAFDVLVCDLGLPDGTGLDVVRALRARAQTMMGDGFRAIALSGLGMEEDVQKALAAGFNLHMTKPVHFDRLQAAIGEGSPVRSSSLSLAPELPQKS